MGTILQFQQSDASLHSASDVQASLKRRKNGSAEIIIFPGVRIERKDDPEIGDTVPKTRKRAKGTVRQKV